MSTRPVAANTAAQWIDGTFHFQYGTNCVVLGHPYEENLITSFAGYWGSTDATYPAIGDLYFGRVFVSIPGNACSDGITDALIYVNLPSNTYLYSDTQNSVHCYWKPPNGSAFQDVTNDQVAGCQTNPTYYPGYGYYMAWPALTTGARSTFSFRSTRQSTIMDLPTARRDSSRGLNR